MASLKDKYKGWVIVNSGNKSFLGLVTGGSLEEMVYIRPCFELKHQVHVQDRGQGQMPATGIIPVITPPDLCLTADVTMHARVDSYLNLDTFDEDLIAMYHEIIMAVVQQFATKRAHIRQAQSGIIPSAPANFDPSKFKGG